ncbi:MAG TPA: hypothetical protein GX530_08900 [Corynebacteriales bacterium]|nr:hypothetical protein [Mycobacteriales bacterium]
MKNPIIKIDTKGNVRQLNFELNNVLEQAYREIECDLIDIITIHIDDIAVDVIVDDEGLMKENPIYTVYASEEMQLFGNVLLVPNDINHEGEYHRGFTDREITVIQNNIKELVDLENGLIRKVLMLI